MNNAPVTVLVTRLSIISDELHTVEETWTRGDIGKGGLPTVISPAGSVCSVSGRTVFTGAIRRELGFRGISGEGVRLA